MFFTTVMLLKLDKKSLFSSKTKLVLNYYFEENTIVISPFGTKKNVGTASMAKKAIVLLYHGLNNYIDTRAKCRHLKIIIC
jgi:hypothetical protein